MVGSTIHDPLEQSNIFNKFFASKSSVQDPNDPVPYLQRKEGINPINMINTRVVPINFGYPKLSYNRYPIQDTG